MFKGKIDHSRLPIIGESISRKVNGAGSERISERGCGSDDGGGGGNQ
jgi:hypothetical protein